MSPRRAVAALVLLVAAGVAVGYVRETTVTGFPDQGKCLWWGHRAITFKVNTTSAATPPGGRPACPSCTPCLDADAAAALVASTVPTWSTASSACSDLTFTSGGTTSATAMGNDGVNLVVVRTGWCSHASVVPLGDSCRSSVGACAAKYNCWEHGAAGTIGLTTTTFDSATGEILDADIELFGKSAAPELVSGYALTCSTSTVSVDLASLTLHEAGHVLGLDHTCQYAAPYDGCPTESVMQPIIPTGGTRRSLVADDVAGVCTIYPKGAATLTCGGTSGGGGSKSGGCDSAGGTGALALLGGALALLRARRRR